MKTQLGLDIGTNSIGWALVKTDFEKKTGELLATGSRIIPMDQRKSNDFGKGNPVSNTSQRTAYRGTRRLYQRKNLRRERLLRVLQILDYLPTHFSDSIDFVKRKGQFKPGHEVKISHVLNPDQNRYDFYFKSSFDEMIKCFEDKGHHDQVPADWTLYYLRTKALTQKVSKHELSWILLSFNQKRGYYQSRDEDLDAETKGKEFCELSVDKLIDTGEEVKGNPLYKVLFTNGWEYEKSIVKKSNWLGQTKEFIVTTKLLKDGTLKRSFKEVDSEADWAAIKAKKEDDLKNSNKTVGQYIFDRLLENPKQKIRGRYLQTIGRAFYKDELEQILSKQASFYPELCEKGGDLFINSCNELYPKNIAHQKNLANKNLKYLLIEDILFYQRPLKSKKGTIAGCQFERRKYKVEDPKTGVVKEVLSKVKVVSKSNPLFQEYRLWQFINNLKIYRKEQVINGRIQYDVDVTDLVLPTEQERVRVFDFLISKKDIDEKQLLNFLSKEGLIDKNEKTNKEWNYFWNYIGEKKKYPAGETRYNILSRLKKVKNVNAELFLTSDQLYKIWHILYSVKDPHEFNKALKSYAVKNELNIDEFVESFKKHPPYSADYGSLSYKALKKIVPLMRLGKYWSLDNISDGLKNRIEKILNAEEDPSIPVRVREKLTNYSSIDQFKGLPIFLCNYLIYGRHAEAELITKWDMPQDIENYLSEFKQHSLRNPIVETVILESLRVVKDIWIEYGMGKPNFFDEIHVELAREVKNSAEKRKKISSRNQENENTNHRIRLILKELQENDSTGTIRAYSPSQQEKLKLYEEGVFQNPDTNYTNLNETEVVKFRRNNDPTRSEIQKYRLWLEQGYISPYTGSVISLNKLFSNEYEIEHIIPRSRFYNNSLSNKVICESVVNKDKGNYTAYEYINKNGGSTVGGFKLLSLVDYESHCKKVFANNRAKINNLLSDGIPDDFISRQLNDTRYITKKVLNLMSNIVRKKDEKEFNSSNVLSFNGSIISDLRNSWGLNDVWNDLISPRFERMNQRSKSQDYYYWDEKINTYRCDVPDDLKKGFSKKRIDHRHHALDAIVIACADIRHRQYLTSLDDKGTKQLLRPKICYQDNNGRYTQNYIHPWKGFTVDVLNKLHKTLISFKKDTRVINKTNNKTWQWVQDDSRGSLKKKLVKQTQGDSWAVRKPLHIETVYGKVTRLSDDKKTVTSNRVFLSEIKKMTGLNKVLDQGTRKILLNHIKNYINAKGEPDFEKAFDENGVIKLNENIKELNGGKNHKPIYKVKQKETGSKFALGLSGNNSKKFVEAAKGTNLYFAVYVGNQKRAYETIPFYKLVEYQKQVANVKKSDRYPIPVNTELGEFLFFLSPNDLVFVPTDEEMDMPSIVDFSNLSKSQVYRIYVVVSFTRGELLCRPTHFSKVISKKEFNSNNKDERVQSIISDDIPDSKGKQVLIKSRCWKLNVNRIGKITSVEK